MSVDILVLKVRVKLRTDGGLLLSSGLEDDGEGFLANPGVVGDLGALLWETFGADDLGPRESLGPVGNEDVVLDVGGDDVGYLACAER